MEADSGGSFNMEAGFGGSFQYGGIFVRHGGMLFLHVKAKSGIPRSHCLSRGGSIQLKDSDMSHVVQPFARNISTLMLFIYCTKRTDDSST